MKVGIIGCGKIAQVRHIPEYMECNNVELAGFYDFNKERAAQMAERFGGKAYSTIEELLGNKEINAVSVCVANNAHAEVTVKALRSGKNVLCEKPMAATLEECELMVAAANETGMNLMIAMNQRFAKAHVKARELLQSGEIGDVITFKTTFGHSGPETWSIDAGADNWFFDKTRAAMGAMADLGVHKTDLIRYLLNQNIVETTAHIATLDKKDSSGRLIGVDDNAICIYKMESGIIGTMCASWTYYGAEDNVTVIYGSKGIMKIYADPNYSIIVHTKAGERIFYDIDKIQTNESQTKSGVIESFVESVTKGTKPAVTGEDVINSMRAIFASIESSEKNITVKIDLGGM